MNNQINIKYTDTDVVFNGINVLVYGEAGVGKTTLMGTAPKPLIISNESGLLSLKDKRIPYIEVHNMDDLYAAYEFITSPEASEFETICLDSISEMAEMVLAEEKGKARNKLQAYGIVNEIFEKLLRCFRDIPKKNVVFSAKSDRKENSDGSTIYQAYMPGNALPRNIAHYFDEVFTYRFFKDEEGKTERWLQTTSDGMFYAKDRSNALDLYEKPNLTDIFNKIKGDVNN